MRIIFLGLSNKKDLLPFDENTNSGKIINEIITKIDDECLKLNLVQYAPLDKNGKLRYPNKREIDNSIPIFLKTVKSFNPDLIIGFGNIVKNEISKIDLLKNKIIFKKHPSYIFVYDRKNLNNYINDIVDDINKFRGNL